MGWFSILLGSYLGNRLAQRDQSQGVEAGTVVDQTVELKPDGYFQGWIELSEPTALDFHFEIEGPPIAFVLADQGELSQLADNHNHPVRKRVLNISGEDSGTIELPSGVYDYVVFREQSIFNGPTEGMHEESSTVRIEAVQQQDFW